jgi:hypothetical protein
MVLSEMVDRGFTIIHFYKSLGPYISNVIGLEKEISLWIGFIHVNSTVVELL